MIVAILLSLHTVLTGYSIAFAVGITLAILCNLHDMARAIIMPIANICRPISAIALYPVIVMYIGIGFWARVFVLTWISLPVVMINTLHALDTVKQEVIDAAKLETNALNIMWLVRLPMSYKSIISTLNVTVSTTWVGLTAAEMLGASDGLGFKILEAAQSFNYPLMYTYILIISAIGFSMSYGMSKIYKKMES